MTKQEILKLVNNYIGVVGGDLQGFSFNSLQNFYPLHCNLDIDTNKYSGTKRQRFEAILADCSPADQAKIIRGLMEKYPPVDCHSLRTPEARDFYLGIAVRLEGVAGVMGCSPHVTCDVVDRAIADAKTLIEKRDMVSAVDRVHTALHGYMRTVCDDWGIAYGERADIPELFGLIRENYPAFTTVVPMSGEIMKICRGMGKIVDALNHIRDQASMAHPNKALLEPAEALLAVNVAWTILHYIDSKLAA